MGYTRRRAFGLNLLAGTSAVVGAVLAYHFMVSMQYRRPASSILPWPTGCRACIDPLRTVIEATTKLAAEEQAARLGFGEPWAHPVTIEKEQRAQWIPVRHSRTGQVITRPAKRGIRV